MEGVSAIILIVFSFLGLLYILFRISAGIFPSAKFFSDDIVSLMTGAAIISACLVSFFLITGFLNLFPKYTFYDTFKFAAPEDITELKASKTMIGNNDVWLQFHAGKQTTSKILTKDFFEVDKLKRYPDNPNFIDFVNTHKARVYEDSHNGGEFSLQNKWIAYDENAGEVFYYQFGFNAENY